jgi:hypothetical protein
VSKHHDDFVIGALDGDQFAREHRSVPRLPGGAYSVGFLYAYRRSKLGRPSQPDRRHFR